MSRAWQTGFEETGNRQGTAGLRELDSKRGSEGAHSCWDEEPCTFYPAVPSSTTGSGDTQSQTGAPGVTLSTSGFDPSSAWWRGDQVWSCSNNESSCGLQRPPQVGPMGPMTAPHDRKDVWSNLSIFWGGAKGFFLAPLRDRAQVGLSARLALSPLRHHSSPKVEKVLTQVLGVLGPSRPFPPGASGAVP